MRGLGPGLGSRSGTLLLLWALRKHTALDAGAFLDDDVAALDERAAQEADGAEEEGGAQAGAGGPGFEAVAGAVGGERDFLAVDVFGPIQAHLDLGALAE